LTELPFDGSRIIALNSDICPLTYYIAEVQDRRTG
jgi:hypothetical protein